MRWWTPAPTQGAATLEEAGCWEADCWEDCSITATTTTMEAHQMQVVEVVGVAGHPTIPQSHKKHTSLLFLINLLLLFN